MVPRLSKHKDYDEPAIVQAILAGDSDRFHDLIRPHERIVYLMALSIVKNEADAEDVAQVAFLKAYRNLAGFRAESKFGTWLISITRNEARSRLRRQGSAQTVSLDDDPDNQSTLSPALLQDWREIPIDAVEREEIRKLLHEAVTNLPEIYRHVFLLRDIEELSINETATALDISVSSVKIRLHRARIMLQKQLSPLLKRAHPNDKRRWLSWF